MPSKVDKRSASLAGDKLVPPLKLYPHQKALLESLRKVSTTSSIFLPKGAGK